MRKRLESRRNFGSLVEQLSEKTKFDDYKEINLDVVNEKIIM